MVGGRTKIRGFCSPRLRCPRSLPSRAGLWCTANVQEALFVALAFLAPSRAGLIAWALRSATLVGKNRSGGVKMRDLHRTLLIERFERTGGVPRGEPGRGCRAWSRSCRSWLWGCRGELTGVSYPLNARTASASTAADQARMRAVRLRLMSGVSSRRNTSRFRGPGRPDGCAYVQVTMYSGRSVACGSANTLKFAVTWEPEDEVGVREKEKPSASAMTGR